jgi:hypothetical protein
MVLITPPNHNKDTRLIMLPLHPLEGIGWRQHIGTNFANIKITQKNNQLFLTIKF